MDKLFECFENLFCSGRSSDGGLLTEINSAFCQIDNLFHAAHTSISDSSISDEPTLNTIDVRDLSWDTVYCCVEFFSDGVGFVTCSGIEALGFLTP